MELGAQERHRLRINVLESENAILQMRLYETGQINQANELRLRAVESQTEEIERLREATNFYQRSLARQQGATEYEKNQHALTTQSLARESQCHQMTVQSLEHERAQVRDFIDFLDALHLPISKSPMETSVGALWLERNDMKAELEDHATKTRYLEQELEQAQEELEHKRLLLKNLSKDFGQDPQATNPSKGKDEDMVEDEEIMSLGSGSDRKANTPSRDSSDEEGGNTMPPETSARAGLSAFRTAGKSQQRKRRHSWEFSYRRPSAFL